MIHDVQLMCISFVRHFIGTDMDTQVVSNTTLLNIFSFFHWHYHQYRNKIPLKQENAAMLYQLETFTTLKFCMFIHRTCCQEKIYFHIIIFFHIVYNFYILPIIKRHLEKLKYWHNISQMCKKNITWNRPCVALVLSLTLCATLWHFSQWHPFTMTLTQLANTKISVPFFKARSEGYLKISRSKYRFYNIKK